MGWIITAVLPVAKELFSAREKLAAAEHARRNAVATYFDRIAAAVDETLDNLNHDRIPYEPLSKIRVYSKQMPEVIGGLLPDEEIQNLVEFLEMESTPQEMYEDSKGEEYAALLKADLAQATGTFKALADSIRAKM
jgi:hypothetical protein